MLEYGQRLLHRARNVLAIDLARSTGRQLFDAAVSGGARALGIAVPGTGTSAHGIAEGASADLVSFDIEHAALAGRERDLLLDSWIFTGGREAIDCVWVRGRKVVSGGRHRARDNVAARYRRVIEDVLGS
jgi:cytosine/adenosine deaminase-related metal-dependent hydrolase